MYEALRRERYSEQLQSLDKNFVKEVASYLKDREEVAKKNTDLFSEEAQKNKKQLENAISIFKELILRRKKKILDMAFISVEVGISKHDLENMLLFEKEIFEKIMRALNEGDKKMEKILTGVDEEVGEKNKLIIFKQDTEEFINLDGSKMGPFKKGDIVNIAQEIANILIVDNKADSVDQN